MREKLNFPDGFLDEKLPSGYFSHSQYGCHKRCGKQYEFSYVQGLKLPPSSAQFKGQALHAGVERALRSKMDGGDPHIELGKAFISDYFAKAKDEGVIWEEKETEGRAKDDTIAAYYAYHNGILASVIPISVEACFIKRVGSIPMMGYIDLIDKPTPVSPPVVCDLKYTKQSWSQEKLEKDTQFSLYSIVTGHRTVRVDNVVRKAKGLEINQKTAIKTVASQKIFVEDLEETVHLVKTGVFPKAPIDSWQCTEEWCGYWKRCRGKE